MQEAPAGKSYSLVVNAGSSSIKCALFDGVTQTAAISVAPGDAAARAMLDWAYQQVGEGHIAAVGHRLVHGGPTYTQPCVVDAAMLANLKRLEAFDPQHLPSQLQIIEVMQAALPNVPQIVCFDTAFHANLPVPARTVPIPRRYQEKGIRRYGFHGLSYSYVMSALQAANAAQGRVVIAHLGGGVSLAAVKDGVCIDTTMGFTPTGGVPMSTRTGDLDPGVLLYLLQAEHMTPDQLNRLVNYESGLLGMSGKTGDMEQLLDIEAENPAAAEAVQVFCYQLKKAIGSLVAALGGIDTLVFTGGMGEAAPKIRTRVCEGLEHLGIHVEAEANQSNLTIISPDGAPVTVRVVATNEAAVIAAAIQQLTSGGSHAA